MVAALAAVACVSFTDPALPASAVRLTPPEIYARWWAMTEDCSGATGALSAVTWYEVPDASSFDLNGESVGGYWSYASNRIVLAGIDVLDGATVRHEMLHALLQGAGSSRHPREQFLGKCAGVVDCAGECVDDAGPPPSADPLAVTVPPESLDVTTAIGPIAPVHTREGDFFSVTVTVRNAATHPVIVALPPVGASGLREGYRYEVRRPNGSGWSSGVLLQDPSGWQFAAGETKRQVFDFASQSDFGTDRYPPNDYQVSGAYGRHFSAYVPLTIAP